jgi:DNA-binding PadR family transcriptional regulator
MPSRGAENRRPSEQADEAGSRSIPPLLVLHFVSAEPTYGNRIIEAIREMSGGFLTLNPNTIYPLLRRLEEQGLLEGAWEHPEKRTRRYYTITPAGRQRYQELKAAVEPYVDGVIRSFSLIKDAVYPTDGA